jgi:hypothetical protein
MNFPKHSITMYRLGLLLTLAALAGCAATPLKKLEAPLSEAEKAGAVVIFLQQSEVAVDDVDVQNAGGGLIGALIEGAMESTMTRNRQKAIAPLRDALLDYDYERKLIEALQQQMPTSMVTADATFKVVRNEEEWRSHLATVVPATVFLITTRYAFEQDFDIAYVHASADLSRYERVPPDARTRRKMSAEQRKANDPTVLHRGSYYSQHVTRDPLAKLQRINGLKAYQTEALLWANEGAEPVRQAFSAGLTEVATLIQRDGNRALPEPADASLRVYAAHSRVQPMVIKAKVLEQAPERTLFSHGQNIFWVDNRQIKR